jgi:cytidine deaminase
MRYFLMLFILITGYCNSIETAKVSDIKYIELSQHAKAAIQKAYIPKGRSAFLVGSAILTSDGKIITGANIKLPCGLDTCAERVALYQAIHQFSKDLHIAAIAVETNHPQGTRPCGVCREALQSFMSDQSLLIYRNEAGELRSVKFKDLLPLPYVYRKVS